MFPFWIDFSFTALSQMMTGLVVVSLWVVAMFTCRPCGR